MLADYYTKALQGGAFMRFWYVVMGHKHIDTLYTIDYDISSDQTNIEEREDTMIQSGNRKVRGKETKN